VQERAMLLVAGTKILSFEPGLVARDVVAGLELEAEEGVAGEDETLLRQASGQRMDPAEVRIEAVEPAELALRRGDPRIVVEVESIRRRRREHHLPVERRAVRRILRQQPVQQRGSGARQSGDEERPAHRLRGDLGMAAAIPPHAEPVRQQADHILPRGDAAEEAEPRLAVEVRDQALQWLVEPGIAEVVEAGPLPGLLEKELAVEAHEREARTLNDPAAAPECARQRAAVGAHALRAC